MTQRIVITIELPDGAVVAPPTHQPVPQSSPAATPPAAGEDPYADLPPVAATPAVPSCPYHHKPARQGKYGWYCTAKASDGSPANDRGYCAWRPA